MVMVDPAKLPFSLGTLPPEIFDYDRHLQRIDWRLQVIGDRADDETDIAGDYSFLCSDAHMATLALYVLGEREKASLWAERTVGFVEDNFFGAWRDRLPSGNAGDKPPDRVWWDRICAWQEAFEASLIWASALGAWDRLERIAGYLRDDVKVDFEQSRENRAWLLLVAGLVRGRDRAELQNLADTILNGKKVREKQLLWTLDAILEQAPEEASGFLEQYAKRYLRVEMPENMTNKLAVDASFLLHWAEYSDVELEIPDRLRPHIVSFDN